jgi:hypothetical protein
MFLGKIHAQRDTLDGAWEGVLSIERDGKSVADYEVSFRFFEKNDSIKGISYILYKNWSASMDVVVTRLDDNTLQLKEIAIRQADTLPSGEWCIKEITLQRFWEDKKVVWRGTWSGKTTFSQCSPGKISLKKVERA